MCSTKKSLTTPISRRILKQNKTKQLLVLYQKIVFSNVSKVNVFLNILRENKMLNHVSFSMVL